MSITLICTLGFECLTNMDKLNFNSMVGKGKRFWVETICQPLSLSIFHEMFFDAAIYNKMYVHTRSLYVLLLLNYDEILPYRKTVWII